MRVRATRILVYSVTNAVAPRNGGRIESYFQIARRSAVIVGRVFGVRASFLTSPMN